MLNVCNAFYRFLSQLLEGIEKARDSERERELGRAHVQCTKRAHESERAIDGL